MSAAAAGAYRQSVNPILRVWKRYLDLLETRPLPTKAVSAFVIGAAGDVLAQSIDPSHPHHEAPTKPTASPAESSAVPHKPGFHWDKERTLRLSLYGLIFGAPITHGWYKILDRRLGHGMDLPTALKKVAADQLLAAGPLTAFFFTVNSAAEGMNVEQIKQRLEQNMWPTMKANWAIWPAALAFNFWFVPLKLRVLFVNILGLGWGTYLSFVQHQQHDVGKTRLPDPYPAEAAVPALYPPGPVVELENR
ncbi:hypothetical protein HK097_006074 [Rhizophlyctis rosea]|uniref:Uncharacterized protein n=1 Tax=Rhizophlyctis rosea TaxID=64517 RepID=A0AAD5SG09_9FUNG|nr:hypothetical protein HK097_006074 [Rhizophlyctis rosea]